MRFFPKIFGKVTADGEEGWEERPRAGQSGWIFGSFGSTAAKVHVTEQKALTYSAVNRAIHLISNTIGYLPWHVLERVGDNRERRPEHPLERILRLQPNNEMTSQLFRETLQAHALGWGNGYAEIERNRSGEVIGLWPLLPDRTAPMRSASGEIIYEYREDDGQKKYLPADRVFHLRGLGFDGLIGYSPIRMAREAIALGIVMETYGASLFANGTRLSGVLQTDEPIKDENTKRNILAAWKKLYSGARKAGETAILEGGLKFQQLNISPADAQFLDGRRFQISEIARWYGVPPHKLYELTNAHFNNIELQNIDFVTDCLLHWTNRWEQEAEIKLFRPDEPAYFTHMDVKGLMRGDTGARTQFYKTLMEKGVFSINDVRALEDMNGIGPLGDQRFVPLNMVTLENAGKVLPKAQRGGQQNTNNQGNN